MNKPLNPENAAKVGIGVMVVKDGKVLLGKRKGSHGAGEYAWPGGHLEYMESFTDCAKREIMEETGIEVDNIRFLRLMNIKDYAPKHYVDIALLADWKKGEPKVLEPNKVESWGWYDIDSLPQPLFKGIPYTIEAFKTGRNFWDA
ncbi:MAG TPA: NUDIX domain-containing protein [Candidatus Paceibacterota bacterium]|nr:NUDIX domain-containing protein [Candidatus Paceibacterota bacterium]